MQILLILSITWIAYTYVGYPLALGIAGFVKGIFSGKKAPAAYTPSVTLVVAAYNEAVCMERKIENSLALHYPAGLLQFIFVTDGSDDGTPAIVARYPQLQLLHDPMRRGKIHAMHRAMEQVKTEIVVFTDANTMLNPDALLKIGRHFADERTGGVAGEKRVSSSAAGAMAGEGLYWKYESMIKRLESQLHSVAGAAGELFSIRTGLYQPIPADTIVDDLVLSMQIAMRGYRIRYEADAYATEEASPSVTEERKRKTRIAAGDIQALLRIPFIKMLFVQPLLWFAYTSHRVLRWIIVPYLLFIVFASNLFLFAGNTAGSLFLMLMYAQFLFYAIAIAGWLLRGSRIRAGIFFVPFYFCLMHLNLVAGAWRYIVKGQSVNWEKAVR